MEKLVEHKLGRYRIIQELGEGGFATVYQAVDTKLDRKVALKILHPTHAHDSDFIQRFQHEAKVTAEWSHPNIATIFEVDQIERRYLIAMQYIPGQNLRDLVQDRGSFPLEQIVQIVGQVGDALDYAHERGTIHRDVKPSNIILDENGHATLTDFGIVKVLEGTTITTTTGAVLGTPYYVSPEQVESEPLDGRSDLYSLGVVAYQLLTGQVPFDADNVSSLYYKIVHKQPPLPSEINLCTAGPIEDVLLKALAKRPEDRYQSGKEFATALWEAVEQAKEKIDLLYEDAAKFLDTVRIDDADAALRRILAIDPGHAKARTLLDQVGQRRELGQRYQALVLLVRQARAQAEALKRECPTIDDPEGILRLLTSDVQLSISEPSSTRPKPGYGHTRHKWGKRFLVLRITALILIVASLVTVIVGRMQLKDTGYWDLLEEAEKFYQINLITGLAIGVGGVSCALLVFLLLARTSSSDHQVTTLKRQLSILGTAVVSLTLVSAVIAVNKWLQVSAIQYTMSVDVIQDIYMAYLLLLIFR